MTVLPKILALEGLPAMGKTTLANSLASSGFVVVNESLGRLSPIHLRGIQEEIFQETVEKYTLAKNTSTNAVIDRGYPSLLAWDYCAEKLGYAMNLKEKEQWVNTALLEGRLYEPFFYVYLRSSPEVSFRRRPIEETKQNVWSSRIGLEYCTEYYEYFFNRDGIKDNVITIESDQPLPLVIDSVMNELIKKNAKE